MRRAGSATVITLLVPVLALTIAVPPAASDTTAPRLDGVSVRPSSFRAGTAAQLRFTLDEAASVAATVERRAGGVRAGRRCVAPPRTRSAGGGRRGRCTLLVAAAAFGGSAPAGAGAFALPRSGLRAGGYVATVVATDAAGNSSALATAVFRVLPTDR